MDDHMILDLTPLLDRLDRVTVALERIADAYTKPSVTIDSHSSGYAEQLPTLRNGESITVSRETFLSDDGVLTTPTGQTQLLPVRFNVPGKDYVEPKTVSAKVTATNAKGRKHFSWTPEVKARAIELWTGRQHSGDETVAILNREFSTPDGPQLSKGSFAVTMSKMQVKGGLSAEAAAERSRVRNQSKDPVAAPVQTKAAGARKTEWTSAMIEFAVRAWDDGKGVQGMFEAIRAAFPDETKELTAQAAYHKLRTAGVLSDATARRGRARAKTGEFKPKPVIKAATPGKRIANILAQEGEPLSPNLASLMSPETRVRAAIVRKAKNQGRAQPLSAMELDQIELAVKAGKITKLPDFMTSEGVNALTGEGLENVVL